MNLLTQMLHLVGSGAVAYVTARNLCDLRTRPNLLAGFQMAESGSVPFLEALSQRAAAEGDDWLAEKLHRHAEDERRHGQIFAHALKQLNKQAIDFSTSERTAPEKTAPERTAPEKIAGDKPNERRRSPFFAAYYEGYAREDLAPGQIDWIVFFASTHILELDACKDFIRMANMLSGDDQENIPNANLKKGLLSIAKDEQRHAAYLLEAMERRLSYVQVMALVDRWRTRKVNAMLAMVSNLLQKGGQFPALAQDGVPREMADGEMVYESANAVEATGAASRGFAGAGSRVGSL